jgi:YHS domain-containing protein
MEFLGKALRYLFWLLVVSWSVALLRRAVGWMLRGARERAHASMDASMAGAQPSGAETGVAARRLVRDPVCGTHVAEVLAIPLRDGGEVVHFCSTACRDKYVQSIQRMAAGA